MYPPVNCRRRNFELFAFKYLDEAIQGQVKDFTKKSYQKILSHVEALNLKSPSNKYGHDKAHRTLFVYQNPATIEAIMKQLFKDVSGIDTWFLFKSFDEVKSDGHFKQLIL